MMTPGTIHRLASCGFKVVVLETAHPSTVRRQVAFSTAVTDPSGLVVVEGITGQRCGCSLAECEGVWESGRVAVVVDPDMNLNAELRPHVIVDGIIAKVNLGLSASMAPLVIALGPGFTAPTDCHVVVETNRGHYLGQCIREGQASPDTGVPGTINGVTRDRVLYSEGPGVARINTEIGALVKAGDTILTVGDKPVITKIDGCVRGLIEDGFNVPKGHFKVGDVDPRGDLAAVDIISDKARAVSGAVLEAVVAAWAQFKD
ncbi:hypothetical protein KIPB_007476 [Kipferlia bialata]|uniref:EF2563 family selenium-dependent molybdenum hydroxylase system protein n=1 Tax=Kipferlia bialata TaxID=797122 RepID=A0A9K3GK16_9EUKA|nr:hypothetical protein KIPB_007476 [Kipferlia bialata]|eukprot:g7476.t1